MNATHKKMLYFHFKIGFVITLETTTTTTTTIIIIIINQLHSKSSLKLLVLNALYFRLLTSGKFDPVCAVICRNEIGKLSAVIMITA
jgi:hypothetical protein